ncbi:MAG: hypothetical protein AAGA45_00825 [Verrucomicrobiota bacterium]
MLIALISLLVVKIIEELTLQVRSSMVQVARDDLRYVGLSALETSIAVISEVQELDGDKLHGPNQGWADPIAYAEGLEWPESVDIKITITDESGKFPLQAAKPETLRAFFEYLEIDFSDAETMTDSLLDWTDEDDSERLNGAESRYYELEDLPIKPPNAALKSWDALRYIQGFKENFFDEDGAPNDLHRRFTESFSLHTEENPNINTMSTDVLETLAEQYSFETDFYLDYLKGQDRIAGTGDDAFLTGKDELAQAGIYTDDLPVTYESHLLKVVVEVSSGEMQYMLNALVDTGTDSTSPNNRESATEDEQGSLPGEATTSGQNPVQIDSNDQGDNTDLDDRSGSEEDGSGGRGDGSDNYRYTLVKLMEGVRID